jgi:hypothetical protein
LSSRNLYSRIKCEYGEWRTIEDFPDYEVSDSGFVRHMNRRYRVLLGGVTAKGYLTVVLMRDYAPHTKTVHSLVAEAFLPKPDLEDIYEVNHIDGNKNDNSCQNLEWLTHGDNVRHAFATGLHKRMSVRILETDESFDTVSDCAAHLGISVGYIYGHLKGHFPSCRGYHLESYYSS